jgi:hypothetical protein
VREPVGFGLQLVAPGLGERVVAALAPTFAVGLAGDDEAVVDRALEQRVERAGRQADLAVGELGGAADDRVAVQRSVDEARQGEVARGAELDDATIDRRPTCRPPTYV